MQTQTIESSDAGARLDRWFKRHYKNVPFTAIAKLVRMGKIKLNDKKCQISDKVKGGDTVTFPDLSNYKELDYNTKDRVFTQNFEARLKIEAKKLEKNIIFMDDNIIVLNKPEGLATQGGTKIQYSVDLLAKYWNFDSDDTPRLVHRLDKDTSGVLLLARNALAAAELGKLFRTRQVTKRYLALLHGVPKKHQGIVKEIIDKTEEYGMEKMRPDSRGKVSISEYKILDYALNQASLAEFIPITGRTHQIRVHSNMLGTPIIGDTKYGYRSENLTQINQRKLHLHAHEIELDFMGQSLKFHAPIPEYFLNSLKFFHLSWS